MGLWKDTCRPYARCAVPVKAGNVKAQLAVDEKARRRLRDPFLSMRIVDVLFLKHIAAQAGGQPFVHFDMRESHWGTLGCGWHEKRHATPLTVLLDGTHNEAECLDLPLVAMRDHNGPWLADGRIIIRWRAPPRRE